MTLQNKSLMLKVNAKPQLIESSKNKTFKIVLGSKARSKTGCLNCRKRKKKCPEDGRQCLSCKTRGQECIWPHGPPNISTTTHQTNLPHSNTSMCVITRAENTKDEDIPEAMDDIGHLNANVIVPSSQ